MFKFTNILATTALIAQVSFSRTHSAKNEHNHFKIYQKHRILLQKDADFDTVCSYLQETVAFTTLNQQSVNLAQVGSQASATSQNIQAIQQTQVFAQVAVAATDEETKKATCITNMTATFWAADSAATTPLSQFNAYVGTVCPALDLRVPSKYRKNHN